MIVKIIVLSLDILEDRYFDSEEIKKFESDIIRAKLAFFDIVGISAEVYFTVVQS